MTPAGSTLEHSETPLFKQHILFRINYYYLYLQIDQPVTTYHILQCYQTDADHLNQ